MIEVQDMPRKKQQQFSQEDWISVGEAARIVSEHSEHTVSPDYVRGLGNQGKIETWTVNSRMKLYNRAQVEALRVKQYKRGE
jgi:hypothetical protein